MGGEDAVVEDEIDARARDDALTMPILRYQI